MWVCGSGGGDEGASSRIATSRNLHILNNWQRWQRSWWLVTTLPADARRNSNLFAICLKFISKTRAAHTHTHASAHIQQVSHTLAAPHPLLQHIIAVIKCQQLSAFATASLPPVHLQLHTDKQTNYVLI